MVKRIFSSLFFISILFSVSAQTDPYYFVMYRLQLTDKDNSEYSVNRPQDFLSEKAIDRRLKYNIPIEETDLPVSSEYITQLESIGCIVVTKSKWLNTVAVLCHPTKKEQIAALPFVENITWVWESYLTNTEKRNSMIIHQNQSDTLYAEAFQQIKMHNGDFLHESGYKGQGITIAVIDGGFTGVNAPGSYFGNVSIKGTKHFVYKHEDVYDYTTHGTNVLSCMAGNYPGEYVGTAPEADFWLFCSEYMSSEYPIEEDYWVAAAEYADSIGVDMINSSLGYSTFDGVGMSHTYSQLDGKTTQITRGAEIAVEKGIFVVSSAGNEGNTSWRYIQAPADGENVFTVGAVRVDSVVGFFSSRGPTYDGRVKPDVMAVGEQTSLLTSWGSVTRSNGTSFAAPIMTGLVACFWQANPQFNNKEIAEIVRRASDRYSSPNNDYGNGIPDMKKAMEIAKDLTDVEENKEVKLIGVNIRTDIHQRKLIISKDSNNNDECTVKVYSVDGREILVDSFRDLSKSYILDSSSSNRVFVVQLHYQNNTKSHKICF